MYQEHTEKTSSSVRRWCIRAAQGSTVFRCNVTVLCLHADVYVRGTFISHTGVDRCFVFQTELGNQLT